MSNTYNPFLPKTNNNTQPQSKIIYLNLIFPYLDMGSTGNGNPFTMTSNQVRPGGK